MHRKQIDSSFVPGSLLSMCLLACEQPATDLSGIVGYSTTLAIQHARKVLDAPVVGVDKPLRDQELVLKKYLPGSVVSAYHTLQAVSL